MTRPPFNSLDAWDWEHIPVTAHVVLERWWSTLYDETPWRDMHHDDRLGEMRRVVHELLNEARDPDDGRRPQRLAAAARAHGRFRRAQQCSECDIGREIGALRVAIASLLLETGWSRQLVAGMVIVLELDLSTVREAFRRGWSRDGVGADGVVG